MSLRIDIIPNRKSTPQILLRKSWREGKRVRHKTVVNLTGLPQSIIDAIGQSLKGGVFVPAADKAFRIHRAWPHGHVLAAFECARSLGLERILDRTGSRASKIALAAIVSRLVAPASKLATAAQLSPQSATTLLAPMLGLGRVSGNEMLNMLDWLHGRQRHIENALANRHLQDGALILYDVSSSYVEGKCCPLAAFGYSRDKKRGKRQIVYGLLCSRTGCPVGVEVFEGNTADPSTVGSQVEKILSRYGSVRVALVGDRGMITSARIRENLISAQLSWISALGSDDIRKLICTDQPAIDPDSLEADTVAQIESAEFPGERLMVCLNPRRREDRRRKRSELLDETEKVLKGIQAHEWRSKSSEKNRAWMN